MRRVCAPRRLAPDIEAAPLLAAATSLDERAWLACPADGLGEAAVPLVAVGGTANFDHAVAGRVRATSALSPALADALASVGVVVARARLVRLRGEVASALDSYHWFRRAVVCVAIAGALEVTCGETRATLAPGEVWSFAGDRCVLRNLSPGTCMYLVIETRDPEQREPGRCASSLTCSRRRAVAITPAPDHHLFAVILLPLLRRSVRVRVPRRCQVDPRAVDQANGSVRFHASILAPVARSSQGHGADACRGNLCAERQE